MIYDLKLHEIGIIGEDVFVIRVPGGWIYRFYNHKEGIHEGGVFVPFNLEFQPIEKIEESQDTIWDDLPDSASDPDFD